MTRLGTPIVLAALIAVVSSAGAQTPAARFQWKPGQVLTYKFAQATTVTDVVEGTTAETTTKLNETKRWQVLAVDPVGIATLQLSLTALRLETTTPTGATLLFDSANPDKSTPQLKEQVGKFVNQPLAVLRVDPKGKVVEVKESKHGPASRFESDPPFTIVLPDELKAGQAWERNYQVTLEPPQGTGEKHSAVQKYTCKSIDASGAAIGLTTGIPKPPEAAADRIPLLPFLAQGEVVFDVANGMLKSAKMQIEREVTGHQGEGSSYRFKSVCTEEYAGSK